MARYTRELLTGARVSRTANGVHVLLTDLLLMAVEAEFVDLLRDETGEVGSMRIVTRLASIFHRAVQILTTNEPLPIVTGETDIIAFHQQKTLAETEVRVVAIRTPPSLGQSLMKVC